ncbi:MAG: hypothetical protein WCF93_05370 [Candidatus Moraniibacteriota bacterium]
MSKTLEGSDTRPWYDNPTGIKNALVSLPEFLHLIAERHQAGQERNEKLNEFYVFGRWFFDCFGNCGKISKWIPKEQLPEIPDILTKDQLWGLFQKKFTDPEIIVFYISLESELPKENAVCPFCKKSWTIENCHDVIAILLPQKTPTAIPHYNKASDNSSTSHIPKIFCHRVCYNEIPSYVN